MNRMDATTGDIIIARLKQLGTHHINHIISHLYFIIFEFEPNIEVSYVYNINAKNQYFLQRISPYPLPKGLFSSQDEIVAFIEKDIAQFKNASNSSNFKRFLDINNTFNHVEQTMEHLFLNYNVPKENIDLVHQKLADLNLELQKAKSKSTHIMVQSPIKEMP